VSSSSASSDSESETSQPQRISETKSAQAPKNNKSPSPSEEEANTDSNQEPRFTAKRPRKNTEQAFEDFYLQQVTKEFANDLDKLRSASDFRAAKSVPLLIAALKQGTACFGKDERVKVGGRGGEAAVQ
jgi:ribosome assembly protein 3